jgi:hypothetical protein
MSVVCAKGLLFNLVAAENFQIKFKKFVSVV